MIAFDHKMTRQGNLMGIAIENSNEEKRKGQLQKNWKERSIITTTSLSSKGLKEQERVQL